MRVPFDLLLINDEDASTLQTVLSDLTGLRFDEIDLGVINVGNKFDCDILQGYYEN